MKNKLMWLATITAIIACISCVMQNRLDYCVLYGSMVSLDLVILESRGWY